MPKMGAGTALATVRRKSLKKAKKVGAHPVGRDYGGTKRVRMLDIKTMHKKKRPKKKSAKAKAAAKSANQKVRYDRRSQAKRIKEM